MIFTQGLDVVTEYMMSEVVIPLCHFRLRHGTVDIGSMSFEIRNEEEGVSSNAYQHIVKTNGSVMLNFLILNLCSGCWEASGQFHALAILSAGKELLDRTG